MIEVYNVNPINKGDTLASCSVYIKPWHQKINDVVVFQKGLNRWVNLPQKRFENKNGEIKYTPIIEWDAPAIEKRFRDQILKAVDEYIEKNGDMVPEDVVKEDADLPF